MDVESLLVPISDEQPCGPDLEYDPLGGVQWSQLQSQAEGEKVDGITQPPDWSSLQEDALAMAARWKHLRLGVILLECGAELEGFAGLRDGLALLHAWSSTYWDTLHPCGDADDIRDLRPPLINSLDAGRFLVRLGRIPLAKSIGGVFSFEDYEAAKNASSDDDDARNQARLVIGTFESTPKDVHQANLALVTECLERTRELEGGYDDRLGLGHVDLAGLRDLLSRIIKALEGYAWAETASAAGGSVSAGGFDDSALPGGVMVPGAVNSRQSAIAALDSVIRYFEKTEPSSPVPYLLRRAQRCVGKSFMELVEELANDRAQAELILKPHETSSFEPAPEENS